MPKIIVFATHPDDEVAGCSSRILREKDILIVYITSESEIRKNEAAMMALFTGLKSKNILFLNYKQHELLRKETVNRLKEEIKHIIKKNKPKEIYVPAYEGGNFFHDLTNYAVNKALEPGKLNLGVYEFTLYNNYPQYALQKIARRLSLYMPIPHKYPQRFIPVDGIKIISAKMTQDEIRLKKHMLRIYKSQNKKDILVKMFSYNEKYRINPKYDYRKRPHLGPLNYEITKNLRFKDFLRVTE